jgi:hypothetical protein
MRLEKKRQEELKKRAGLTGRTIAMVIWLILSFGIAYFLVEYLFAESYLTEKMFYVDLSVPSSVPEMGLKFMAMFLIVVVMQIIFYVVFFLSSPEGRRRTGDASLQSRNKDPFDDGRY